MDQLYYILATRLQETGADGSIYEPIGWPNCTAHHTPLHRKQRAPPATPYPPVKNVRNKGTRMKLNFPKGNKRNLGSFVYRIMWLFDSFVSLSADSQHRRCAHCHSLSSFPSASLLAFCLLELWSSPLSMAVRKRSSHTRIRRQRVSNCSCSQILKRMNVIFSDYFSSFV